MSEERKPMKGLLKELFKMPPGTVVPVTFDVENLEYMLTDKDESDLPVRYIQLPSSVASMKEFCEDILFRFRNTQLIGKMDEDDWRCYTFAESDMFGLLWHCSERIYEEDGTLNVGNALVYIADIDYLIADWNEEE